MNAPRLQGLKVALVYPPYGPVKNEPGIKTVKENYGIFPSLSLLYVAGILENAGVEVLFLDSHAHEWTLEETVRKLKDFGPDYIGYTITTYLFFQTLDWIKAIKAQVDVPTIVGGVHLSIYPRETLTHESIDFAITGEAEVALPEFLWAHTQKLPLENVKGLAYRVGGPTAEGGRVLVTENADTVDVDLAPFPARHLLDNTIYHSFISKRKNFSCFITSRGCPYKCIFCEQGSKAFRARSPKNAVDELEMSIKEFGIHEMDFFDSSFTIRKERVIAICDEIKRRKLDVIWAARTRVDCITPDVLKAMQQAGCTRIYYGIESGNREILKVLKKSTSLDVIKRVVRDTKSAGIDTFGYFMVGNPYDTPTTVRQTIRLALDLDLDYAQFSKVTPMPATEMYTMLMKQTGRDYWREFVLNPHDDLVPRPHCDMTDEEIQRWTRLAYLRFYYRPSMMKRRLAAVESMDELVRSANTAWKMVADYKLGEDATGMEVVG
ncbi:MAG: radical SAM protein [Proteobacteria bacterium]|nr:radical SAM protein [Pseudomonadota bacterium]